MFVVSPPGQPDEVWIGGAMNYDELPVFGGNGRSNGRAVMRSTDAGVSFTDMTNDDQDPPLGCTRTSTRSCSRPTRTSRSSARTAA